MPWYDDIFNTLGFRSPKKFYYHLYFNEDPLKIINKNIILYSKLSMKWILSAFELA